MATAQPKNLRFAGDPKTLRGGGVYVKTTDIVAVVNAVQRFWRTTGSALDATDARTITGAHFKRDNLLAISVLPPAADADGETWIGIYDSAPYSTEAWSEELATALHEWLAVPAFHYYVGPATRLVSYGRSAFVGLAKKSFNKWASAVSQADRFPHAFFFAMGTPAPQDAVHFAIRVDIDKLYRKLEFEKGFWRTAPT